MKILYVLICILLFLAMTACESQENAEIVTDVNSSAEQKMLMPEMEYAEIAEKMLHADTYGKPISECGLNEENVYLSDEKMYCYDYVSLFDVHGTLSVYLSESKVSSIVFGSEPFEDIAKFQKTYADINEKTAGALEQNIKEPSFRGAAADQDESERLLNGTGYYLTEYETDVVRISVKSCGVNGVATIVVECAPKK